MAATGAGAGAGAAARVLRVRRDRRRGCAAGGACCLCSSNPAAATSRGSTPCAVDVMLAAGAGAGADAAAVERLVGPRLRLRVERLPARAVRVVFLAAPPPAAAAADAFAPLPCFLGLDPSSTSGFLPLARLRVMRRNIVTPCLRDTCESRVNCTRGQASLATHALYPHEQHSCDTRQYSATGSGPGKCTGAQAVRAALRGGSQVTRTDTVCTPRSLQRSPFYFRFISQNHGFNTLIECSGRESDQHAGFGAVASGRRPAAVCETRSPATLGACC